MMRILIITVLAWFFVATSNAQFVVDQATFHSADCYSPALASSPNGITMLAYGASGDPLLMDFVQVQTIPTTGTGSNSWPAPQLLNAGGGPAICYSRTGFHVAFESGGMILIYSSDLAGNWDLESYAIIPANGYVQSLNLLGITSDAAGPDVFLTAKTFHPGIPESHRIVYASHSSLGWTDLSIVLQGEQYSDPEITWSIGPAGPYATIFFLEDDSIERTLKHTTLEPGVGWSAPVSVAGSPVAQEYAIVTSNFLQRNILGLGPAPTCPCGTISHQEYSSGQWSDPEDMTAIYADYDQPGSPNIAVGTDGLIHAFWMQSATAFDFTPWRKSLEYRVLNGGVWTDAGDFLNEPGHGGPIGQRVALTAHPAATPVLAWTRRDTIDSVPQPEQIWIARQPDTSPVPDSEVAMPKLSMSAWPNPFNPQVRITFEVTETQMANLTIYDARGRQVACLLDGLVYSGHNEMSWSGKDDTRRNLPSGILCGGL